MTPDKQMIERCPFCGGDAVAWGTVADDQYVVTCGKAWCAEIRGHTEAEAIAAWNTRAPASEDDVERAYREIVQVMDIHDLPDQQAARKYARAAITAITGAGE